MTSKAMAAWHHIIKTKDQSGLDNLLADEVVFHSPVVHTPQEGKFITKMYLMAAAHVLGGDEFTYVREVHGPNDAFLEFETVIDGIHINGIDMIRWNEADQITDFKVMLRPLKAVNKVHQMMGDMLNSMKK
ncbi:MAG: nuclear transport factor 2 family protein [Anaerolineae bacterium]